LISAYRYGFNGKENDDEAYGDDNQQDYGMRVYDPRLGRFLSVDPIAGQYPELTPYQFASNSPISGIDLDGLEFFYAASGKFIGRLGSNNTVRKAEDVQANSVETYIRYNNNPRPDATPDEFKYNTDQAMAGSHEIHGNHNDFSMIAAVGYNENLTDFDAQNATIGVVFNRMKAWKKSLDQVLAGMAGSKVGATHAKRMKSTIFKNYAAFMRKVPEERNKNMQKAVSAAIAALESVDKSNGSIYEKGRDFFNNEKKPDGTYRWRDYKDGLENGYMWDPKALENGDYTSKTKPNHKGTVSNGYKYIIKASHNGNIFAIDNPDYGKKSESNK
jgi:RHS repeat-associated protein